jgi:hypothetical protein
MGRILALLALPLAGCDVLIDECVEATFYPDHGIEVKNAGAYDAQLIVVYDEWVKHEDEPDEFRTVTDTTHLSAGEKQTVWYPQEPMNVKIIRIFDGQVLFEDHFSRADFRGEHDRIELTVYP